MTTYTHKDVVSIDAINVEVYSDHVSVEQKVTMSDGKVFIVEETPSIGYADWLTDMINDGDAEEISD